MNWPEFLGDLPTMNLDGLERSEAIYAFLLLPATAGFKYVNLLDDLLWEEFYNQLRDYALKQLRERTIYGS